MYVGCKIWTRLGGKVIIRRPIGYLREVRSERRFGVKIYVDHVKDLSHTVLPLGGIAAAADGGNYFMKINRSYYEVIL